MLEEKNPVKEKHKEAKESKSKEKAGSELGV